MGNSGAAGELASVRAAHSLSVTLGGHDDQKLVEQLAEVDKECNWFYFRHLGSSS